MRALLLAALCLGLLFLVYIDQLSEEPEASGSLILKETGGLNKIKLTNSKNEKVTLKLAAGQWQLESLPEAPLSENTLKLLIESLKTLKGEAVEGLSSTEGFGFDEPNLVIELNSGESLTFGKLNTVTQRRYMQLGSTSQVFMVGQSFYKDLDRSRYSLRDKNPVDFEPEKVTSIVVRKKGGQVHALERGESGQFRYQSGVGEIEIDEEFTEKFLEEVRSLLVVKFIDEPESYEDYGLRPEKIAVAINFGDEEIQYWPRAQAEMFGPVNTYKLTDESKVIFFGERDGEQRDYFFNLKGEKGIYQYALGPYGALLGDIKELEDRTPFNKFGLEKLKLLKVWQKEKESSLNEGQSEKLLKAVKELRLLTYLDEAEKFEPELVIDLAGGLKIEIAQEIERLSSVLGEGESAPRFMRIKTRNSKPRFAVLSSGSFTAINEALL